ncbi:MAG: OmpA family protein, partial [Pseudomonadota bacterium]
AVSSVTVTAQETKLLHGSEVTESVLIESLTPPMKFKSRSIKLIRDEAPVKAASASLLITFETNSAILTQDAMRIADKVARALNSNKLAQFHFNIEGHADPRGNTDSNLQLSEERAASVRQYLVDKHGIDAARLVAIGKGSTEPINAKDPAAAENRRVTIVTLVQ